MNGLVNYSATSNRASKWHRPLFFFPVFPDCQECVRISQLPMRRDAFCCRYSAWSCILHTVVSGYPCRPSGCCYFISACAVDPHCLISDIQRCAFITIMMMSAVKACPLTYRQIFGEFVQCPAFMAHLAAGKELSHFALGKGTGYERWAKGFNLKQTAKTLLFLQQHDIYIGLLWNYNC